MTHCTQLPTMPWVLELAPCKQRMDTEASKLKQNGNLQDKAKPQPSSLPYLQELQPLLSLAPCQMPVLNEVTPLPDHLAARGASWDQLSEQQ